MFQRTNFARDRATIAAASTGSAGPIGCGPLTHGLTAGILATPAPKQIARIRLLLILGCQRGELAGMTRDEVDLEKAIWTLQGAAGARGESERDVEIRGL